MKKKTILCVDDEKMVIDSLKEQLRSYFMFEYNIETAESGDEALEIFKELQDADIEVPLIIADYLMPKMKGDELLIKIHQIQPKTISILLTGHANADAVGNIVNRAKLYRYITKPWEKEDFLLTVKEALRSYNQEKKLSSLITISQQISSILHINDLLNVIVEKAVEISSSQRGYLFLRDKDNSGELKRSVTKNLTNKEELPSISEQIVKETFELGEKIVINDDSFMFNNITYHDIANWGIKSVISMPIKHRDTIMGVCYLDRPLSNLYFTTDCVELVEVLITQVAISFDNASLYEDLEHKVEERTEQLAKANEELKAFTYRVSHDIKSPLTIIESCKRILERTMEDKLTEQQKEVLEQIGLTVHKISNLVDSLMLLSKAIRKEMDIARVNLSNIVKQILAEYKLANPERKVLFEVERDIFVKADRNLINIVMNNLIGNALKYSEKKDTAFIEFGILRDLEYINNNSINLKEIKSPVYYIKDKGVGFDMKYAHKLFQPFERINNSEEYQGSGIGLATVEKIISRHSGKIWAESNEGEGASFFFFLDT